MPRYSLLKVFSSIGIFCANTDSLALRWVELCLNIFFQTISRWHPDTGLSSKTKGTVLQGFNVFFIKPESENVRRKPYTKVQNLQPIFLDWKWPVPTRSGVIATFSKKVNLTGTADLLFPIWKYIPGGLFRGFCEILWNQEHHERVSPLKEWAERGCKSGARPLSRKSGWNHCT